MGQYIAEEMQRYSNQQIDIRVSVLGHIQQGGIPSAGDRLIVSAFGKAAVDLVAAQQSGLMVVWQNGRVVPIALESVLQKSPQGVEPGDFLVQTARSLGIYVGF